MFSGIEFQILDPEYEREFLKCSVLGLGTYKKFSVVISMFSYKSMMYAQIATVGMMDSNCEKFCTSLQLSDIELCLEISSILIWRTFLLIACLYPYQECTLQPFSEIL